MSGRSISLHNSHPRLRFDRNQIEAVITVLDAYTAKFLGGCPPGELSIAFLTDAALAQIHARYMGDPATTDVITFGSNAAGLAGEICVSVDTAARYVGMPPTGKAGAARLARFSAELTLYIVHGWLHLAGYDDRQPAKKRQMRAAEKRGLTLLQAAKALPEFRLKP